MGHFESCGVCHKSPCRCMVPANRPKIVCLCGSTRFFDDFARINREETLAGHIVLAPGVFAHNGDYVTELQKELLDELHFRKIDLCDEVIVINRKMYVGDSTRREIGYAKSIGRPVLYLFSKCDECKGAGSKHELFTRPGEANYFGTRKVICGACNGTGTKEHREEG